MSNTRELIGRISNSELGELLKPMSQFIDLLPSGNIQKVPEDLLLFLVSSYDYNSSPVRAEHFVRMFIRVFEDKTKFLRSFVSVFSELESDQLVLLRQLRSSEIVIVDKLDLDRVNNQFINREVIETNFPVGLLSFPDHQELYINHLVSRNLVEWPVFKQDPIVQNSVQTGVKRHSKILLSAFGKAFSSFIFQPL